MSIKRRITLAGLAVLAASCTYISQGFFGNEQRGAIATQDDYFGDSVERIAYPDQNWDEADSLWFYNTTQGSDLLPYNIFINLEQADSQTLFRSDANMRKFRYLPQRATRDNPDGLPVGWVKDSHKDQDYIGLTCAACHTGQINYGKTGIRIDGGPALADMNTMLTALASALDATVHNPDKFQRLAKAIDPETSKQKRGLLRDKLIGAAGKINRYNRQNQSLNGTTQVAYGYARLDAFGRIYNRILSHLTPGVANANPPNAPVSYPFLWDTPQHDFVQWNGVADNMAAGPLGRNTGEVLGVFANFSLQKHANELGFRSSVALRNLTRLERHLRDLWSPSWQELAGRGLLPKIDTQLAEQGRSLFARYRCASCHQAIDRRDPKRRVIAQMSSLQRIGTDPQMARNALLYKGLSGYFEGQLMEPAKLNGKRFGATTSLLPALTLATSGVILNPDPDKTFIRRWAEKGYDLIASLFDNKILYTRKHLDFKVVDKNNPQTLLAYKGRPLDGIWATAPYLHNGSVRNLYQLLLPSCRDSKPQQACRDTTFTLGSRTFDPVNVGFVARDPKDYPGLFTFDTRLPGNSNRGHEYAAGITPVVKLNAQGKVVRDAQGNALMQTLPAMNHQQRLALVEYLKTL